MLLESLTLHQSTAIVAKQQYHGYKEYCTHYFKPFHIIVFLVYQKGPRHRRRFYCRVADRFPHKAPTLVFVLHERVESAGTYYSLLGNRTTRRLCLKRAAVYRLII